MPWNPDYLEDGEIADDDSLNDRFRTAMTAINTVGPEMVRRGAFNHKQGRTPMGTFPPNPVFNEVGDAIYSFTTFGSSLVYASYANDASCKTAVEIGTGDRVIINHESHTGSSTSPPARIFFAPGLLLNFNNTQQVNALLCLFNVNVAFLNRGEVSGVEIVICLQAMVAGSWYTIHTSEKRVSYDDHIIDGDTGDEPLNFDVPIVSLITPSVITSFGENPATAGVSSVAAFISLDGGAAGMNVSTDRWNLSVIPLMVEHG